MKKAVLITRPAGQADVLLASLAQHQLAYYHIPAVDILPRSLTEQEIACIQAANTLIFISQNAAMHAPFCAQPSMVFAVGESTQQVLYDKGYSSVICPSDFSTEGLLALPMLQVVDQQGIVIIRGVGGREALESALLQRGARCESVAVYARAYPAEGESKLQALLAENSIGCVVATSGEILQNLLRMAGSHRDSLQCLPLIVISQRIARLAKELGFRSINIIDYTDLVRELCQKYVAPDSPSN